MNRKSLPQNAVKPQPSAEAAALAVENESAERRRIRARLRLPMIKRTHFLRVRIGHGSAL